MDFLLVSQDMSVAAEAPCAMICNNLYAGCTVYCGGVACTGLVCPNGFQGDPIQSQTMM